MAIHSSQVTLRAKWRRGWALMRAGKTTEGYDLLAGIKLHNRRKVIHRSHENPAFRFDAERNGDRTIWRPYPGIPAVVAGGNGAYTHDPQWYRTFVYTAERARGLDDVEDLASPGIFRFALSSDRAAILTLAAPAAALRVGSPQVAALQVALRAREVYRGPVDGELGPATETAIVGFQRRAGIVPDGLGDVPVPFAAGPIQRLRIEPLDKRGHGAGNCA